MLHRAAMPRKVAVALALLAGAGSALADDPTPKRPVNRLARETSPYLLHHADNPVDWFPWGPEAFAKAKAEGKPILLSIGYSACYWCHVMERESFRDQAIARTLNDKFVCIKVDREERPDVDQIYMTALQAFGQGGWPMSMFLMPDGRPFFGGTYFPPKARDGLPAFSAVLDGVATAWRDERPEVEKAAEKLTTLARRSIAGPASAKFGPPIALDAELADAGLAALAEQFDPEFGGFGFDPTNARRPKFPEPVNLVYLLDAHRRNPQAATKDKPTPLAMATTTLDRMARGGIRDQLAGGYHRYATSRYWIVPHFEKMLYDNAQLASAHLLAFEATNDPRWRREAEDTFAFVARSLTAPEGGFYSSIDAETDAAEGAYYVWSREQVAEALGSNQDAEMFSQVYGLKRDPNFEENRYVLLEPRTRAEQAANLMLTPEALEAKLAPARAKLLAVRDRRPAPARDDKVLTSWNGLMIAALADGARVLKDDRHRVAADRAADFLLAKLRTPEGRLLRTHRAGQSKLPAYLEDYAFLAHGLLRLHAASGDPARLAQARDLADRMIADFADPADGGFFFTAGDHESLLARPKDPLDGALPGANSVAIRVLVALGVATNEPRHLDEAGKALKAFAPSMARNPAGAPLMLVGLREYLDARPDADIVAAKPPAAPSVVSAKASLSKPGPVAAGSEFEVAIELDIKPGWHVYANPSGSETSIPTVATLADPDASPAASATWTYPAGKATILDPTNPESIALYEGKTKLLARVKLKPDVKPGPATIKFRVRHQACNDRACLAPANLTVTLDVQVAGG